MADIIHRAEVTAGWLADLAESEAELPTGLTVPGETVRKRVRAALAWFDDQPGASNSRRDTAAR